MKATFLLTLLLATFTALQAADAPRILVREALQFENIGDSGRVPGTLRLLREHLPQAEITLWPWQLHQEREREMFLKSCPQLRIVTGEVDESGNASTPELAAAWKAADILITPARQAKNFTAWAKTGRPYGLFGAAFDPVSGRQARCPGPRAAARPHHPLRPRDREQSAALPRDDV